MCWCPGELAGGDEEERLVVLLASKFAEFEITSAALWSLSLVEDMVFVSKLDDVSFAAAALRSSWIVILISEICSVRFVSGEETVCLTSCSEVDEVWVEVEVVVMGGGFGWRLLAGV